MNGAVVLLLMATSVWAAGCDQPPARDPDVGDVKRGGQLLTQYHCGSCHTIPGVTAARGQVAVTLASFGRRSYIAGRVPNTHEQLTRWIMDPASLVPQATMPSMGVSAADARDMAAYLGELQ